MQFDREVRRILVIIGDNLRAERNRRGLSQEELARLSGLGTTQIARMERGESDTGVSKYIQVAWAMEVSPSTLMYSLDTPNG